MSMPESDDAPKTTPRKPDGRGTNRGLSVQDVFVGWRLREARRMRECSQEQLGEALGVSFQAIQKYENGEHRMSAGRLVSAAAFLNMPLAFFAQDLRSASDKAAAAGVFDNQELALVKAYRALPNDRLRAHMRRFMAAMADEVETPES